MQKERNMCHGFIIHKEVSSIFVRFLFVSQHPARCGLVTLDLQKENKFYFFLPYLATILHQ